MPALSVYTHSPIQQDVAPGDDRIRRYYLFRAVTSFSLWMPFWTLWINKNVENLFLLTIVDTAFWVTMIAFQLPAGLLGDKYGRKTVLFVGEVVYAVGILAFGLSSEFWTLLASNVVWALGVCFVISGDTPFLYDTLVEVKRQGEFINISARAFGIIAVMQGIACTVAAVFVEYIAPGRFDLTLIISAIIGLCGCGTIVFLKEPKVARSDFHSYGKHLREGLRHVLNTRAIMVLIVFQIVVEIATYVMAVFRSVYMNSELHLDFLPIGLLFSGFILFGGFVSFQAGKFEQWFGEKSSLLFLLAAIVLSFILMFLIDSPIVIGVQFLVYMVSYLQSPIISGYINKRVDSQHRSTVVATATFLFTVFLVMIELPAGWMATEYGIQTTLLVLAIGVTPVGLFLLKLWNSEIDAEAKAGKDWQAPDPLQQP